MDEPLAPRVDYFRLLRRVAANRWRLILLIFLGVAIPMAVWALVLVPKIYEAAATIFIEDSKKGGPVWLRDWMPPSDASFQVALLRSRSLAQGVVENLPRQAREELLQQAMHRDFLLAAQNAIRRLFGRELIVYSPQERVLIELQNARVRFTPLPSGEVEIRTIAYHPRVAMDLANTYVEVLQTRSRSYAREEARATREFIESLLNQTKAGLQESEEALAKLQRGTGSIKVPERAALELTKLAQMENSLADIQASKEIAKVRLNFLKGGKDATGKPLASPERLTIQQLRDRLAQLEEKLAALSEKYTDQHPLVMATQAEIKQVQGSLGSTLQSLQDPRPATQIKLGAAERAALVKQLADLEVEISSLDAKEEVLKQRIASLSRNLSNLSADEMQVSGLLRRVETQRSLYSLLSEKLGTSRVQEQGEARGLRVIDLASLPLVPSSSAANKMILLGLLGAVGLGAGVAALIEYLNPPIETEDDVTQVTGLPVLGWLPTLEIVEFKKGAVREPLSFGEPPTPNSLPVEGCRSIRTTIESLSRHRPLRTIMLTSPGPREGKSTVLLNLAWVFWELGRRLVVVDSDLRRPALHRALRSPAESGLVELLKANVSWDQVRQPIREDFSLVPAGSRAAASPGDLLSSDKIRKLLDLLKERADLVLFDSAPVLAVSDNLTLASMLDGVILVVRSGHTQRRDLIRAKEQLEKVGAPILGVVLNRVSPRASRRYYVRYADYYGASDRLRPRKNPWNPQSWWRRRRPRVVDITKGALR